MSNSKDSFHAIPIDELLKMFKSSVIKGLSNEAVDFNRTLYGINVFPSFKRPSFLSLFLDQFFNPLIYLLISTAALIFFFSPDTLDIIIIVTVILFNSLFGASQEWKIYCMLDGLEKSNESSYLVIRNGEKVITKERDLVCGDLLCIQEGQRIPADARIIETEGIAVDESILTGESTPVIKNTLLVLPSAHLFEQKNMLFCGTTILTGSAIALVCAVGKNTQFGTSTNLASHTLPSIPLEKELRSITYWIITIIFFLCLTLFLIGYFSGKPVTELFTTLMSLFICVIPEGLPMILTFILVNGTYGMSRYNVIIKNLRTIETLGRTNVILTDKTGTLTQNQLQVTFVYANGAKWVIEGAGYSPEGKVRTLGHSLPVNSLGHLAIACSLMNRSSLGYEKNNAPFIIGDSIEVALAILANKIGIDHSLENTYSLIFEIPFDPQLRYHAALYHQENRFEIFVIGSPEVIIHKEHTELLNHYFDFLQQGLRVVAVGHQKLLLKKETFDALSLEEKKQFLQTHVSVGSDILGLCAMHDTIRKDAHIAIEKAKMAGIRVVMLTGDHSFTAHSVATATGICDHQYIAVEGSAINKLNDKELDTVLNSFNVFSRLAPNNKMRIVQTFQKKNLIVLMIGDGINDVSSLSQADIGVAMGSSSVDNAKNAADLILLDNSLLSLVAAIAQGRRIFYTLRRVILYFFSTNFGEIFIIVFSFLALLYTKTDFPLPFTAGQILWLNLVTDGLLDMAVSLESDESDLMSTTWFEKEHHLFTFDSGVKAFINGLLMAIGSFTIFILYYPFDLAYARTMTLITMSMFQWFNAWNCRSENHSIFTLIKSSKSPFLGIVLIALLLQGLLVYCPYVNVVFKTVPLKQWDALYAIACASSIIVIEEGRKWILLKQSKK